MAKLSTEQLLFLNNLMYMSKKEPLSSITSYPTPCTVEDIELIIFSTVHGVG